MGKAPEGTLSGKAKKVMRRLNALPDLVLLKLLAKWTMKAK
jgi:hypothetical protein